MKVRILYFARLRETFGLNAEHLQLPDGVNTVGALIDHLRQRGGVWAEELGPGRAFRVAVNQDMAAADAALSTNDEVAIFPPVTGG